MLNARVNLIFYFLTLALSFFSRKIFLDTLGADFVGLTGTLQNLLGFLNLAELGVLLVTYFISRYSITTKQRSMRLFLYLATYTVG